MPRTRLDVALVQRGLVETRERAQSVILAGRVTVDGSAATRTSLSVADDAAIQVADSRDAYVSRGAQKLLAALGRWPLDVTNLVCLDVGASTGGFTDVLLQRGAARVYAVDVGYGQLHYRLRSDPRVVVMERTNVRYLDALPEAPRLAVTDVSFISLTLALPAVMALLHPDATIVALVKPQFEAGRADVGKGGVVRDPTVHRAVLEHMLAWSTTRPWRIVDFLASPLRGPAGNVEFLSLWRPHAEPAGPGAIERALRESAAVGTTGGR